MEAIKGDEGNASGQDVAHRARQALEEAARRGIPPDPRAFELFYAYLEGLDPDLVAAVDAMLSPDDGPNLDALERIYEEHLAFGDRAGRYLKVGEQVARELGELTHSLDRQVERDDDYLADLLRTRDGASILMRPGAGRRMVRELIALTEAHSREATFFNGALRAAQTQIKEMQEELKELRNSAFSDHLTGLPNRRRFDLVMEYEIASRETRGAFSLVLCDLDHFKRINDGFGHGVGDSVLTQFARLIRQNVQGRDTPARYGGEEFAIILPSTELLGARHVAERIRQTLASRAFIVSDTKQRLGVVTASFGVAEHQADESAQSLLTRADQALYRAKKAGRNRVAADEGGDVA